MVLILQYILLGIAIIYIIWMLIFSIIDNRKIKREIKKIQEKRREGLE